MSSALQSTILIPYYVVLGILALYGIHRSWLLVLWWKNRSASPAPPPEPEEWPVVTVQLPLYNEMYVAARLIDAVARLDYPKERLEIQVLDDSTDETRDVVAGKVAEYRARGFDIHHLHRSDRAGFKAGALAAGAERARGRFLAVFDADFVPPPHFLRRVIPYFLDPHGGDGIGMVQARCDHLNRDYSLLTRIQAVLLDGHFLIEHTARHRSGRFFNFNGTAGVWRREGIEGARDWTLMAPVELAAVAFRYAPGGTETDGEGAPERVDPAATDAANRAILDRVNATGEAFLTHTSLDGRVALRISIGNLKTTREDVERVWELLQEAAEEVVIGRA